MNDFVELDGLHSKVSIRLPTYTSHLEGLFRKCILKLVLETKTEEVKDDLHSSDSALCKGCQVEHSILKMSCGMCLRGSRVYDIALLDT